MENLNTPVENSPVVAPVNPGIVFTFSGEKSGYLAYNAPAGATARGTVYVPKGFFAKGAPAATLTLVAPLTHPFVAPAPSSAVTVAALQAEVAALQAKLAAAAPAAPPAEVSGKKSGK